MAATWIYACFCCQEMMWFTILRWWSTSSCCLALSRAVRRAAELDSRCFQVSVHSEILWCCSLAAARVLGGEEFGSGRRGLRLAGFTAARAGGAGGVGSGSRNSCFRQSGGDGTGSTD